MTRLPFLDPDPPTFGEVLVALLVVALVIGFVLGLFAGALIVGGF